MSLRDDTYQKFGPLLLEALIDAMLDEVNELRTKAGLPLRTKEYFLGRSNNNQNHLPDYDWMDDV
ncbi:hypothetical protein ES703_32505 [subsurface metagenome]